MAVVQRLCSVFAAVCAFDLPRVDVRLVIMAVWFQVGGKCGCYAVWAPENELPTEDMGASVCLCVRVCVFVRRTLYTW